VLPVTFKETHTNPYQAALRDQQHQHLHLPYIL
jgi:hypothetical protein